MARGMIFDIKRYALHDGPGIRTTVFFKGCPLSCSWCHNPEGLESTPEILLNQSRCAIDCRACINSCPQDAISKIGAAVYIDHEKCDLCKDCVDACMYEALLIAGKQMSVRDILGEVEKDLIFYDESGGGVTLSGGEPLLQMEFFEELLNELKSRGIHVAVDTSGYIPFEELKRVSDRVDLFLYDLKMLDDADHTDYTGVSNTIILANLKELVSSGKPVEIRIPLVHDVNDDEINVHRTVQFLLDLKNIQSVCLLPYHKGGCEKYIRLGKEKKLKNFRSPSRDRINQIKRTFSAAGFEVKIGG